MTELCAIAILTRDAHTRFARSIFLCCLFYSLFLNLTENVPFLLNCDRCRYTQNIFIVVYKRDSLLLLLRFFLFKFDFCFSFFLCLAKTDFLVLRNFFFQSYFAQILINSEF